MPTIVKVVRALYQELNLAFLSSGGIIGRYTSRFTLAVDSDLTLKPRRLHSPNSRFALNKELYIQTN